MMSNKSSTRILSLIITLILLLSVNSFNIFAEGPQGQGVVINEIESNDSGGGKDWIELYNTSTENIDLSGWIISDDKGLARLEDGTTNPFPEGTSIGAGEFLVFEVDAEPYNFGLGKNDAVNLYDKDKNLVDSMTYKGHADKTLGRFPDGTGAFVETLSTKGTANKKNFKVVINEVESSDPDWIELYNYSTEDVDLSGWIISDDKGLTRFDEGETAPFPENTVIEAGGFLVFDLGKTTPYNFGLGKNDTVNLYDKDKNLVDSIAYEGHALDTLGRFPDGTGEFVETLSTKGTANLKNEEEPEEDQFIETTLRINEIETNHDVFEDYVEIINIGDLPVDISGWYVMDNDPVKHAEQIIPVPDGTSIAPGQLYVFDTNTHFTFGLGKDDCVTLRNPDGRIADEYSWSGGHPKGTWSRVPDGTGEFRDYPNSKGVFNKVTDQDIVINEIESNGSDRDWVEIFNNSDNDVDISGWYIKDDSPDHFSVRLPQGTIISGKGYFVFEADLDGDIKHFNFGLGSADKVELYDADDVLIDEHTWTKHAEFGLSRIPNGVGGFKDVPLTKGSENIDAEAPAQDLKNLDTLKWPGPATIKFLDEKQIFKEDSSGLDYHDGALWLVDNGTATIWKLELDEQGIPSFAKGFENGKIVKFKKDKGVAAPGPDAEGITLDNKGMVYIASERDNAAKGTNLNMILQVDPNEETAELVAIREWNITEHIDLARKARGVKYYQVKSNMGIEAVEWIPNSVLEGKLFDMNTKAPYKSKDYLSVNGGLFFVGLEDDGFIYVFALSEDEQAVLVTQIDTEMGMVMGLNYDDLTDELWAQTDNGRMNILARIKLNASNNVDITYYNPPQELDPSKNNEGFAIASINVGGLRPVYWVEDGITVNVLKMGFIETYKFPFVEMLATTDSWSKGSGTAATFISSAAFADFLGVRIDGQDVGRENYDLSEGSIVVTFKQAFLDKLPIGKYTVEIVARTGVAKALLEVKAETAAKDPDQQEGKDPSKPETVIPVEDNTDKSIQDKADEKVPTTGETPIIMFAVLSFILSGMLLVIRRKVDKVR